MYKVIDLKDIPGRGTRRYGSHINDITNFWESNLPAAEMVFDKGQNPKSAATSLYKAVQSLNVGVRVLRRGDRVFLIREAVGGER